MIMKLLRDSLRLYPKDVSRYPTARTGIALLAIWCLTVTAIWALYLVASLAIDLDPWARPAVRIRGHAIAVSSLSAAIVAVCAGLIIDWLTVQIRKEAGNTVGQAFSWRWIPVLFSIAANVVYFACNLLSLCVSLRGSFWDIVASTYETAMVLSLCWGFLRGVSFSTLSPGKRSSLTTMISLVITIPAIGIVLFTHTWIFSLVDPRL